VFSCTAIILSVASQWVLFILSVAASSRKTVLEMHEMLKTACGRSGMGQHTHLNGLLNSDVGKLQVKFVSTEAIPPQVTQRKMWGMFTKS